MTFWITSGSFCYPYLNFKKHTPNALYGYNFKLFIDSALQGFHQFNKPGQVNVLNVEWPRDIKNHVFNVGDAKDAIRPKRVAERVYQSAADMALAVARYGKDAQGIVSPEAVRQQKIYSQSRL